LGHGVQDEVSNYCLTELGYQGQNRVKRTCYRILLQDSCTATIFFEMLQEVGLESFEGENGEMKCWKVV